MGLTYRYTFRAPADATANQLAAFLHRVEIEAQRVGLGPTVVLNVPFDTPERAKFAERLGPAFWIQDERLQSSQPMRAVRHLPEEGSCSVIPLHGVVLLIMDERGHEACFGFMQYPKIVRDSDGNTIGESGLDGAWAFEDFVQTPDPRYRQLVQIFAAAGYVRCVTDDFVAAT
jgi:hypothetical protein